jgi:type IV secretion system protein VirB8
MHRGHHVASDPELAAYQQESASWDADRIAQLRRQARLAIWVAGFAWTCAITCGLALMLLMPLKRVEPFVIRVDNSTGVVDVVPVYAGFAQPAEIVTRYLLTHYVTVCERFNFATAESDYQECGAFQSAQRNQAWYAQWSPANPDSPLNQFKDGTTVRASVVSVTFFKRANGVADLAQVRYRKATKAGGGAAERITHWIATIQYTYAHPSKDSLTRSWNPLGFRVLDFRPEAEALTETAERSADGSVSAGARP